MSPSSAETISVSENRDEELLALPEPRRPGRRLTLALMAVTALVAAALIFSLRSTVVFALKDGRPADVGHLRKLEPNPGLANAWVRGEGAMSSTTAVAYSRPLESGGYRLAPIEGNPQIWVQVRVLPPDESLADYFIPPSSFVGRLIPADEVGLRHQGLTEAPAEAGIGPMPSNAWLLLDGEAPATTRWTLALVALLLGFVVFNVYGLVRLLKPVRD